MAGRLAVTACVLLLIWRLGWLKASGVARLGRWQVWLLALAGMICFACAGLYSFYWQVSPSTFRASIAYPPLASSFSGAFTGRPQREDPVSRARALRVSIRVRVYTALGISVALSGRHCSSPPCISPRSSHRGRPSLRPASYPRRNLYHFGLLGSVWLWLAEAFGRR